MAFNNFRANVVARVLLLALLIAVLVYCIVVTKWAITPFILLAAIVAATTEFIYYAEKTNREFTDFLLSIKSSDFSKYNAFDKRGRTFADFKQAMNIIVDEFHAARIDKEANYIFLQAVVEHLNTAIISFDAAGEVKLMNEAAKKLLHTHYLKNIYSVYNTDPILCTYLTTLQPGNSPVFETVIKGDKLKLMARATTFGLQGKEHRLISIQNIKAELEHTELQAWEQLLHVLTHEIMNSLTPISSLSGTLKKKMQHLSAIGHMDNETRNDMQQGLNVIENRSLGLMNFVNQYKSLITLPVADFKTVNIKSLLERVCLLQQERLKEKGIHLQLTVKNDSLSVHLDPDLIEQVVLNLINNAADALSGCANPSIKLTAELSNHKTLIYVADNGTGIDKTVIDKIFIPFFTTKNAGSGIGLSLSKQIMRLHGGSIEVICPEGGGAVFVLVFA